jgi:transposase
VRDFERGSEPLFAPSGERVFGLGEVGTVPAPGGTRPLWAFMMVLGHSRAMWAELVMEMDIHSLRRSLVRASRFFGDSPRQWLFDNAKTVVTERAGDAIRFHPALLDLAGQMHVQPRLCASRQPQQNGKVERAKSVG